MSPVMNRSINVLDFSVIRVASLIIWVNSTCPTNHLDILCDTLGAQQVDCSLYLPVCKVVDRKHVQPSE